MNIFYNNKEFSKDWNGLKLFLEEKLWNLHIEETQWKDRNKKELKRKNINKDLTQQANSWTQQLGKIIFISGILETFWGKNKIKNKVWKERKWKLSKNGNKIIKC